MIFDCDASDLRIDITDIASNRKRKNIKNHVNLNFK